jgi:hypothetical protein
VTAFLASFDTWSYTFIKFSHRQFSSAMEGCTFVKSNKLKRLMLFSEYLCLAMQRTTRDSTDIERKVAVCILNCSVTHHILYVQQPLKHEEHTKFQTSADWRVLCWRCSTVSMQIPGAVLRASKVVLYCVPIRWDSFTTRRGETPKAEDTLYEYVRTRVRNISPNTAGLPMALTSTDDSISNGGQWITT